jgi:hypothetical protein
VFDSLSLTFRDTPQGVFCAHHYRYSPTMSTFLVEVEDATWQRAGFETMSPEDTIRHCEQVFATGPGRPPHPVEQFLLAPVPRDLGINRWSVGKVVLMGDALRTAHFSIGSGTPPGHGRRGGAGQGLP